MPWVGGHSLHLLPTRSSPPTVCWVLDGPASRPAVSGPLALQSPLNGPGALLSAIIMLVVSPGGLLDESLYTLHPVQEEMGGVFYHV